MQTKIRGWLIITGVVAMFAALGWFAYLEGSIRTMIGVIVVLSLGVGAGAVVKLRELRFVRNSVSGHVRVHDHAAFESDEQHRLVQVAMLLEFEGVGVAAGHRIYRIFRLPVSQHERYVTGALLPVRVLPHDLSVIQILGEDHVGSGTKRSYVEARVSQTPIDCYA